jgi:hypothetical protein
VLENLADKIAVPKLAHDDEDDAEMEDEEDKDDRKPSKLCAPLPCGTS